jgi:hypothetical protein
MVASMYDPCACPAVVIEQLGCSADWWNTSPKGRAALTLHHAVAAIVPQPLQL